jgi:hypothetical protein
MTLTTTWEGAIRAMGSRYPQKQKISSPMTPSLKSAKIRDWFTCIKQNDSEDATIMP